MVPICLNDSQMYSIDSFPNISTYLWQYPEICVVYDKTFQFKFTGVIIANNIPVIVFPKNYSLPTELKEITAEASVLIRVLLRYRNEPSHELRENIYLFGGENNNNARITTAFKMIQDYKTYGYLHRELEISSINKKGKIDWSATVNKSIPILNHNRVIYNEPIIRSNRKDNENIVFKIHK